jgi:bifunctional UDP-N-acetylglucosamine pyrophosphorylase/glucosamine-1-phosphate N-acetyltransferase
MKSKTPKVLHPVAGRPLLGHILKTVRDVGARPLVVLSPESTPARELLDESTRVAVQDVPRGTGDAVRVALAAANGDRGVAFIV